MAVIKQVTVGSTTYDIVAKKPFYGTCSTAASTTAKVVACADFTADDLTAGAMIVVKNTTANTGAVGSLTMNVNSTGAKSIKKVYNAALNNLTVAGEFGAYAMTFIYDGTNWVLQNADYNNTYTVTDTKVWQSVNADNSNKAILLKGSPSGADSADKVYYASNITGNAVTGILTATGLSATSLTITTINGVTVGTSPKFTDTDTKVTQTVTTTNATYPLLFSSTAAATTNLTDTARFGTLISANPNLGRVAMRALVVGQTTTANCSGWTTTPPSTTTNAQTGQVLFVVES